MTSKQLFDTLIQELESGNNEAVERELNKLTDEQIDALFSEAQSFKSIGPGSSKKVVIGSVSNMREKYLKKLIMTGMVSFLFQMKDEYTVDESELTSPPNQNDFMVEESKQTLPPDFNKDMFYQQELTKQFQLRFPDSSIDTFKDMQEALSEDDLLSVSIEANKRFDETCGVDRKLDSIAYNDAVHAAIQFQSEQEQVVIKRFLDNLFRFDKNKHVQEGGQPVIDDPERTDLSQLKDTNAMYDNVPPNDTHCRFSSYFEINYEKIREATQNIYNVKPDLEHAMIVYDVVDSQDDANTFIQKYGSSSKYDILTFALNRWTLLGPFKENRERVEYYNKHNAIIKAMLEQQERDCALGEDLMKKRVKTTKVKAEKIFGEDSPGFEGYRNLNPTELETKYNAKVEEMENGDKIKVTREAIVDADTGEALTLDEDGVPSNALEVPITKINAKTGEVSTSRIFTRADET